jgi:hypothetical protein
MNRDSEKPLRLFVNPFAAWTGLAFKTGEMLLAATQMAISGAAAGRVAPSDKSVAVAPVENNRSPRPTRRQSAKASKRVTSKPASAAKTSANRKRKKRAR